MFKYLLLLLGLGVVALDITTLSSFWGVVDTTTLDSTFYYF